MKVKLSDIIEALEFTDDMTHYFLDKTTGEIVMVSEFGMDSAEQQEAYDRLDEHGFYRLPEHMSLTVNARWRNLSKRCRLPPVTVWK